MSMNNIFGLENLLREFVREAREIKTQMMESNKHQGELVKEVRHLREFLSSNSENGKHLERLKRDRQDILDKLVPLRFTQEEFEKADLNSPEWSALAFDAAARTRVINQHEIQLNYLDKEIAKFSKEEQ